MHFQKFGNFHSYNYRILNRLLYSKNVNSSVLIYALSSSHCQQKAYCPIALRAHSEMRCLDIQYYVYFNYYYYWSVCFIYLKLNFFFIAQSLYRVWPILSWSTGVFGGKLDAGSFINAKQRWLPACRKIKTQNDIIWTRQNSYIQISLQIFTIFLSIVAVCLFLALSKAYILKKMFSLVCLF